jgi:hypothetical protein
MWGALSDERTGLSFWMRIKWFVSSFKYLVLTSQKTLMRTVCDFQCCWQVLGNGTTRVTVCLY